MEDVCASQTLLLIPFKVRLNKAEQICQNLGGQIASAPFLETFKDTMKWTFANLKIHNYFLTPFRQIGKNDNHYYNIYTKKKVELDVDDRWMFKGECVRCYNIYENDDVHCTKTTCLVEDYLLCDVNASVSFKLEGLGADSWLDSAYKPVTSKYGILWIGTGQSLIVSDKKNGTWVGSGIPGSKGYAATQLLVYANQTSLMLGNYNIH